MPFTLAGLGSLTGTGFGKFVSEQSGELGWGRQRRVINNVQERARFWGAGEGMNDLSSGSLHLLQKPECLLLLSSGP